MPAEINQKAGLDPKQGFTEEETEERQGGHGGADAEQLVAPGPDQGWTRVERR